MRHVRAKIETEISKFDTLLNNALRHLIYPKKHDASSETEFKELSISAHKI